MKLTLQENTIKFSDVAYHPLNYDFDILITSEYSWFPYRLLINKLRKNAIVNSSEVKLYVISAYGLNLVDVNGHPVESISKRYIVYQLLFSVSFWRKLFSAVFRTFIISLNYNHSLQLGKITINGIKVGDIIAAEYLRDPKFGNGNLKFDPRFYAVLIKYLIVYTLFTKAVKRLLENYSRDKIRFAIQETSFKDEMRRRILIKYGIFHEYQYNKFIGKVSLVEYLKTTEGRVLDFTPYIDKIRNDEIDRIKFALDNRLREGIQAWTLNINDVDPNATFIYPDNFNKQKATAVIFLHAVADDQYRCGLDEFPSLDSFHRFSIDTLLDLGYQCIIKSHPSVISPLHPDKTGIDHRYLTKLFKDYGFNYRELLASDINNCQISTKYKNLIALHPKLSIQSVANKTTFLVVTNHGNIIFEALHLGLPAIKYRYCKNRAYEFCNDWASKDEYIHLLEYFRIHKRLPKDSFRDSYLKVAAILARKSINIDYNKLLIKIAVETKIPIKERPSSVTELYENFKMIKSKMDIDEHFAATISNRFENFLT